MGSGGPKAFVPEKDMAGLEFHDLRGRWGEGGIEGSGGTGEGGLLEVEVERGEGGQCEYVFGVLGRWCRKVGQWLSEGLVGVSGRPVPGWISGRDRTGVASRLANMSS